MVLVLKFGTFGVVMSVVRIVLLNGYCMPCWVVPSPLSEVDGLRKVEMQWVTVYGSAWKFSSVLSHGQ